MIEVGKIDNQGYRFTVKSETGQTLLESIIFEKREILETTLKALKTTPSSKRFERKTNFEGKFLFNLTNEQGRIIGNSGLYTSEAGMENGIKNLKNILGQGKEIKL
ncbi:YegP family protein [Maribacter thermophilus]|uniref:YegP family protein n=1 Tax=Maribacter thermophilus TaxID=1197874 RepID=UPI00064143F7|nr:YegP family protein [Maribacter thermophilus]